MRGIEEILKLSDQYGWERIDAALDVVRVKNPDNLLRTMGYLIGVIRRHSLIELGGKNLQKCYKFLRHSFWRECYFGNYEV